jgi:CAP-Gly domain
VHCAAVPWIVFSQIKFSLRPPLSYVKLVKVLMPVYCKINLSCRYPRYGILTGDTGKQCMPCSLYDAIVNHRGVGFDVWFVHCSQPYTGIQCTNGSYRNKRYFDCNDNCGIFVAVNNITLCDTQMAEPIVSVSSRGNAANDRLEVARRAHRSPSPDNATLSTSLPRPLLEIGDRVVWISDYGPELGTVRWIGILPDSRVKEYTIGVEFVSALLILLLFFAVQLSNRVFGRLDVAKHLV